MSAGLQTRTSDVLISSHHSFQMSISVQYLVSKICTFCCYIMYFDIVNGRPLDTCSETKFGSFIENLSSIVLHAV